jgi:hypothetical protein
MRYNIKNTLADRRITTDKVFYSFETEHKFTRKDPHVQTAIRVRPESGSIRVSEAYDGLAEACRYSRFHGSFIHLPRGMI